jgi:scyllo-inositol 2-dehydrogenase (NADP+)
MCALAGPVIHVGIASFGMSGSIFHGPLLASHPKFRIVRIVERRSNVARERYPGLLPTHSYDELLADDAISLVIVNTPDQTHYEFAKQALMAGKHVVVEKPFTQNSRQAAELIALANHRGKMLTVFQNRRWDGDFLTLRHIVESHALGRIVEFEARWDRYRNYIQPETWKEESSSGAGLLFNLGSHLIDQAMVLFGLPTAVTAHLSIVRTGGRVDDWFDVRLHYEGVNVALRASYLVREQGPRYALHGTLGSFVKFGLDPQEEALKLGGAPVGADWGKEPEEWWGTLHTENDGVASRRKVETAAGNYLAFYDNVYRHLTLGEELMVEPEDPFHGIQIIESATKSSREGRRVPLLWD